MRRNLLPVCSLLIFFLLLLVSCGQSRGGRTREASGAMGVWVASDCLKVKIDDAPREPNHIWSPDNNFISVKGARNEYLGFQVIVRAQGGDLTGVNVAATDLSGPGTISSSNISLFKEHYLNVTDPSSSMYGNPSSTGAGWYPDALIPFDAPSGGAPFNVTNGNNQGVWVDLYIPEGTTAGTYRGTITVSAAGEETRQINLELTVWGFTLPRETHMNTYFYYGPDQVADAHGVDKDSSEFLELQRKYVEMGHQHRINATTQVYWEYTGTGSGVVIDWDSHHDDHLSPYMDGTAFSDGVPQQIYSLPVALDFPWYDEHGGLYSSEYQETFKTMLQRIKEHFVEKGWFDRCFLYIIDEPGDQEDYDMVRYLGRLIDESGTGFPFMVTEQPTPEDPSWGSLAGYVDIWCAGGTAYPGPMNERRAAGDRTWTYNGGEPYAGSQLIDTSGIALRTWPWIAYKYGVECWFLWDCMYWKDVYNDSDADNDVWSDPLSFDQRRGGVGWADWGNGDGTFFYPGHQVGVEGPVSSIRMKVLRRGLQDYEYIWLLEQQGNSSAVSPVLDSLIPYAFGDAEGKGTRWPDDPGVWEEGREQLAAAIGSPPEEYSNAVYFAEGTTRDNQQDGSFDEWLCLSNPDEDTANVTIVYALGTGENRYQTLQVPPLSRTTVDVRLAVGSDADVSAKVTSDNVLVVERPIYFDYHGAYEGGHCVMGVSSPRKQWYFAEGTTRNNPTDGSFEEWICLYNPGAGVASVTINYLLDSGEVRSQSVSVPGTTRVTIDVNAQLGANVDAAATIVSDMDTVAERAVYFSLPGDITGGHCVMGTEAPGENWYFAEGSSRDNALDGTFREYITIANPGDTPADVSIRYLLEGEGELTRDYRVEGQSRSTVAATGDVGSNKDFSVQVSSPEPIVCERPLYFNYRAKWTGGHCTAGATGTAKAWYLAEGSTRSGLEEWLTLGNPAAQAASVNITYLTTSGENPESEIDLAPGSRLTVDVNSFLGPDQDTAVLVESDVGIFVERPMYFLYHDAWKGGHCVVGQAR